MKTEESIPGNKKVFTAIIAYYCCWIMLGIIVKQYANVKLAEIDQINELAVQAKALSSLYLWTLVIPGYLFFGIKAFFLFLLGFQTMKQRQHPPKGFPLPGKSKLVKGTKAYMHCTGYCLAAITSLAVMALITYAYSMTLKLI